MPQSFSSDHDATPAPGEIETMAAVLEGRHGIHAEQVAQFLADVNASQGDPERAKAWMEVTERVRQRETERLGQMFRQ
jgi:hypothetical protein